MCRIKLKAREFLLLALTLVLCMSAGTVAADEDLTWPIRPDLKSQDLDFGEGLVDMGDVSIWNTKDNLYIDIIPGGGLKLEKVSIHIVDDPADFAAILDKKTKLPKIPSLDYSTDYLADQGIPADSHLEVIDLESFEICWGLNPEQCPPNRYIIVHAELQQFVDGAWIDFPTDSYARNEGVFDRFLPAEAVPAGDAKYWGYVTYPLAKAEPGHFVDANVNGLGFVTITQSGTTGDNGQFWYLPGERVAFSVGSLYLGDALGDRSVAPTDLFDEASMEDDRVLNVARLLQSLDADGNPGTGAINITEPVIACLESALASLPPIPAPDVFFADDDAVGNVIDATVAACAGEGLVAVTKAEALENLNSGMMAGNLIKRNVSKNAGMKSDKAQIEILPVYVPAKKSDGSLTEVSYYDADGEFLESRNVAKPIVVSYVEEVEGTGAMDVFIAISRDDGDTWKRRNISRTARQSSLLGYPGASWKPQMKVMDNLIFVAWSDKYCRGGRPGYAINTCDDPATELVETPETGCAVYCTSNPDEDDQVCTTDYPGDDAYWQDDLYGVGGPQRSVSYEDYPELGEVPYSCVWTARGVMDTDPDSETVGEVQWFKPERVTSGRRDAFQIMVNGGEDVAFAMVWQEDPKGLRSGEGDGPGDGWSGSNTYNKTDIWYSYVKASDFALIDEDYPTATHGDGDVVDTDAELAGRVKALVPMSLPVRISDNEICSLENILAEGGGEESEHDGEGQGTHRFCGTLEGIGTEEAPGSNPRCAYTVEMANPKGEIHHVCVTSDNRVLDGNTGASRPNINVQPYQLTPSTKSAWVIVGYEESKGVGIPPDGENEDEGCGGEETGEAVDEHDVRYKPDMGKNVIYHSFDLFHPDTVASGGIVNLPETDEYGNPVYLVDEFGELLLDWKGDEQLAYENARRVRFLPQSKGKASASTSKTSVVILYRQGEEGSGKPADIFMRRAKLTSNVNPYAFGNIQPGAQNLSSVTPTELFQDPFDAEKPVKMLRWSWSPSNLADSSAQNPYTDAHAHRGALNGDDLVIAYTLTPNWGRRGNDKYDLYIRRSFNGGKSWTTDPNGLEPIEHNVVFRVPVIDEVAQTVTWDEEVVTSVYKAGASEPPRNVSNLRNNRISVMEPRLVKTPGTITSIYGFPEDVNDPDVYQIAYGTEFNQNQLPEGVVYPQIPLDIYYGRTLDKGQHFEGVVVTPQGGSGKPEEGWNMLAKDHPYQGAPQIRQTPDGSRLYGIWLEESDEGSDIMFRRVDYR